MAQLIDTNINGTLAVSGQTVIDNNIDISGEENLEGTLKVSGDVYFNDEYFMELWNSLGV